MLNKEKEEFNKFIRECFSDLYETKNIMIDNQIQILKFYIDRLSEEIDDLKSENNLLYKRLDIYERDMEELNNKLNK